MATTSNKNKRGNHFNYALIFILVSITVSLIAFISEGSKTTGFAAYNVEQEYYASEPSLPEYKDVNSLGSLAAGNYYIDGGGIVYWLDGESMIKVAKVNFIYESQKDRYLYIDNDGNVGYRLS